MSVISVSETAKEKINEIAQKNDSKGIRVRVVPKGCSGFSVNMDFCDPDQYKDEKVDVGDTTVVIDAASVLFLMGSTLDWQDDGIQSHFAWVNPNETSRCGCGESFSIS